jgi:hypothetical protein
VGDGFGALLFYTTAVYLGFQPSEIAISASGGTRSARTSSSRGTEVAQSAQGDRPLIRLKPQRYGVAAQVPALPAPRPTVAGLLRSARRTAPFKGLGPNWAPEAPLALALETKKPRLCGLLRIAGAGFEPATFGL